MTRGLQRFQQTGNLHCVTFSCYHHAAKLGSEAARDLVVSTLERVRRWYGFYLNAYVVMPDHLHLLLSEPERASLAVAIQMLKQVVARKLNRGDATEPLWQRRYYDFNIRSDRKFDETVRYIHENPVRRGLVEKPEDWKWSSYRHIITGEDSAVELESQWTARKREWLGLEPKLRMRT